MRTFARLPVLLLLAAPLLAQAPPPAAATQPNPAAAAPADQAPAKFLAADVHLTPFSRRVFYSGAFLSGDRYIIHQATMIHLVMTAWDLKKPGFVGGGPNWIGLDRYDLMAKVPPGTTLENSRVMLQNLLAERFHLVAHPGDVQVPTYVLSVASGKPTLKPSTATDEGSCQFKPVYRQIASFELDCHAVSMDTLAKSLGDNESNSRDYVSYGNGVIDAMGIKGRFDLDLKWTPKWFLPQAGSGAVSLYKALAQYGLNLQFKTSPQPGIVIDSVDREPTPNAPDLAKIMPPPPPPQFEVATIKPSQPGDRGSGRFSGDEMNLQGIPLKFLITIAWDLDPRNDDVLVAPKWIESDRIDIHAKVDLGSLGVSSMGSTTSHMNYDDFLPMLRSLLIDRFEIKYHIENRPIDAYMLEVADPKLAARKLVKADPSERTACGTVPPIGQQDPQLANVMFTDEQTCLNITMDQFAGQIHHIAPDYFFYPVKDETGLSGSYDFTLAWSAAHLVGLGGPGFGPAPPPAAEGAQAADPNGAISFFDAIKKQLGLKVVKEKRPEPVLVIDHIDEQPTEN